MVDTTATLGEFAISIMGNAASNDMIFLGLGIVLFTVSLLVVGRFGAGTSLLLLLTLLDGLTCPGTEGLCDGTGIFASMQLTVLFYLAYVVALFMIVSGLMKMFETIT